MTTTWRSAAFWQGRSTLGLLADEHRGFLTLLFVQVAAGGIVDLFGAVHVLRLDHWRPSLFLHFAVFCAVGAIPTFCWYRLRARGAEGQRLGGRAGWSAAARRFARTHGTARGAGRLVLMTVGVAVATAIHDGWKSAIPILHPYRWDGTLIGWDRALHGGVDPWRWLTPLVGSVAGIRTLDVIYWSWYPLYIAGIVWQIWNTDRQARARFWTAYMLVWIVLGTIVAHSLSSMGPCFIGVLDPASPFRDLLVRLDAVPHGLVSRRLQGVLLETYRSGQSDMFFSISAMPSLHVAMPALFALASWRTSRVLAGLLWLFTGGILVASVYLGWHYAVDGYVAILGAAAMWLAAGAVQRLARSED